MTGDALQLARPWALLLLAAVPLAVAALLVERRRVPRLRHPAVATLARAGPGLAARLAFLPAALAMGALALTAVALARPQSRDKAPEATSVDGIDIVVALDLSSSMKSADFRPSRLRVAQQVLKDLIRRRRSDRIGLVVFAGEAYTQCPLTLDGAVLSALVDELRFGVIEDGTAIGNAIATAVNRLRDSDAKSKAIVLITDGDNNAGQISPREAAEIARAHGIPVFTILVGRGGLVPYPVGVDRAGNAVYEDQEFPVNPDLLRDIARITGGTYAPATDRKALEDGLGAVLDRMEKSRLFEAGATSRVVERFPALLRAAFWLAAAGLALSLTRLRPFP
jgi:Ca-activated chloride channel family protein